MRYSVGQKVKVIKRISEWESRCGVGTWVPVMDSTLGKIYTIIEINESEDYRLDTKEYLVRFNYWYTEKSLEPYNVVGKQLEFSFMAE